MYGGAGINAISLPYIHRNQRSADCPKEMLASIDLVYNEPVVVHIGNHPYNSLTLEKRAKQLAEGGNPFIAPDSWHNFLDGLRAKIKGVIAEKEGKTPSEITVTVKIKASGENGAVISDLENI